MTFRARLTILSIWLVVAGIVWAMQGYRELSLVAGRTEWLWIGISCTLVGLWLLIAVNRPHDRS